MGAVIDRDTGRKADLAAIHIAKASLGWDDDTYRDIMATVCAGVRSAGALDFATRKRFLAHLQACQAQKGIRPTREPAKRGGKAWGPKQRLLWALWQQLADANLVEARTRQALNAWIKRQAGVDSGDFLNPQQLDAVIDSAKRWLARAGSAKGGV